MHPRSRRALSSIGRPIPWIAAGSAALTLLGCTGPAGASKAPKHKATDKTAGRLKPRHPVTKKAPPLGHAVTLTYFVKPTTMILKSASGKTLHAGTTPAEGDSLRVVDKAYAGSHTRHGRKVMATDSLTCTYTSATAGKCSYEITVNGSKVTANQVLASFASGITTMPVNGGTGEYQGAKGLITRTNIAGSRNSDLSIVVLPASS